ncbi:Flavin-linked sulfhydryl oxidase of the mitochondrial IMS [Dimargaris verticillata]|uniref:Sulfhydryl oxidase n=1 Tax=Dimargaris verticillata TaxID=2761393 RepID=A0A9W8EA61_9FUNG|nr:Flavin-linked sulfhydryl oxidase of the mitochondrial IMS [Dimargaris verticillata]
MGTAFPDPRSDGDAGCRVCTDFKSWTKKSHPKPGPKNQQSHSTSSQPHLGPEPKAQAAPPLESGRKDGTRRVVAELGTGVVMARADGSTVECPPDSEALGRSTWTFLHTMAAYYPNQPTVPQQQGMQIFLRQFAQVYPCGHCASHLRSEMKTDPPRVNSRADLSQWMCETHNKVNDLLGKKIFDCSKVDERWRDGPKDSTCD